MKQIKTLLRTSGTQLEGLSLIKSYFLLDPSEFYKTDIHLQVVHLLKDNILFKESLFVAANLSEYDKITASYYNDNLHEFLLDHLESLNDQSQLTHGLTILNNIMIYITKKKVKGDFIVRLMEKLIPMIDDGKKCQLLILEMYSFYINVICWFEGKTERTEREFITISQLINKFLLLGQYISDSCNLYETLLKSSSTFRKLFSEGAIDLPDFDGIIVPDGDKDRFSLLSLMNTILMNTDEVVDFTRCIFQIVKDTKESQLNKILELNIERYLVSELFNEEENDKHLIRYILLKLFLYGDFKYIVNDIDLVLSLPEFHDVFTDELKIVTGYRIVKSADVILESLQTELEKDIFLNYLHQIDCGISRYDSMIGFRYIGAHSKKGP